MTNQINTRLLRTFKSSNSSAYFVFHQTTLWRNNKGTNFAKFECSPRFGIVFDFINFTQKATTAREIPTNGDAQKGAAERFSALNLCAHGL